MELNDTLGTKAFDVLIGGPDPVALTKNVTIASGAGVLTRGTVLGKVTTSGKYVEVKSTNTDGSQTASCVLHAPVDATSDDVVATVYVAGRFNVEGLTFGGTDTYAKHEEALRNGGIYLTSIKS